MRRWRASTSPPSCGIASTASPAASASASAWRARLLAPASLWLVDEPLSALDPTRARQAIDTLIESARERGATLVATLHQVDVATRFARVLGLRDGVLAFDLPGAEVTRERLAQLYAQHEHELTGAGADAGRRRPRPPPTVIVICR